jgi:homoserine dehydrogenase
VVTSNKWPVALGGAELAALARDHGVEFYAESTVMSGTPLLRALVDGLADATPIALRGLLNATTNFILSRMTDGASYDEALAEAQRAGLAERDPAADVEGHDAVVKMMILSALVFGRQLRRDQVACRGITDILPSEVDEATARGARLKHVATLDFSEPDGAGQVSARVQPVPRDDPPAHVEGTTDAWRAPQVRSERSPSSDLAPDRSSRAGCVQRCDRRRDIAFQRLIARATSFASVRCPHS